jgi:hypothetical protein
MDISSDSTLPDYHPDLILDKTENGMKGNEYRE